MLYLLNTELPSNDVFISNKNEGSNPYLGTFVGVFVPCLQNMLGVILFVRYNANFNSQGSIYNWGSRCGKDSDNVGNVDYMFNINGDVNECNSYQWKIEC